MPETSCFCFAFSKGFALSSYEMICFSICSRLMILNGFCIIHIALLLTLAALYSES